MLFKNLLLFFLFAIFASCVPQTAGGGKSLRQTASVGTTATPTPTNGTYVNSTQLYWSTSSVTSQVVTMNANTLTSFYLRGKDVETFLSNSTTFNSIYCLEFNFSSPVKTLRSRLVPTSINNLSNGMSERLFRVDIENETQSQFACKDLVANPNVVFTAPQVCTTCQTTQTTTSVKVYQSNGTSIGTILPNSGNGGLNLSALSLKLDPINNSTSNAGTCNDNQCKNQGYDCCLSGQCIKDGAVKPSALLDPNYTNIVSQLVSNQFSSYTSWPQYYYVCPKLPDPLPTPVPTATADPTITALANLNNLKNDYFCTKELAARAAYPPFNTYDFSTTTFPASLCTGTQTQIDTCLQTYRQNFITNGTICNATASLQYLEVMKRLYSICGCSVSDWTLALSNPNHPVNACPNFSLKAVDINGASTSADSLIVNIQCVTSIPNPIATPFQNLNVNVPARSAPHRFFKSSDNTPVDSINTLFGTGTTPEGTEFKYLDPGTYIMPVNGSFNMNSILGQFNVDLSQALPAKVIDLEYDASYVISTLSGYYTPCPTCMKDSWFSTFTALPQSQDGTGLQAVGYSTDREIYSGNTFKGNYEDTHFGRACFIPPTMIPFSHKAYASSATQRQNRLATQAAYYINGYQRDWYGFNRGAVIGSFDGVTWFAIGKGRRVRATSSKLFLAINAPFADLAAPSSMIVSVRQDEGIATAAEYDYDHNLTPNDFKQNEAATCQRWHTCTKDTDCIAKLGWEYVCADIASLKTLLPKFNSSAEETANTAQTVSISQILQGGSISGSSTKRCVYRGAGAPCSTRYDLATSVNNRKLQACAPNFYCADKASGNFNTEIARFATTLENIPLALNHLYGQDANIIGRPISYASATGSLTSDIKNAITANSNLMSYSSYSGLCRPGRDVTTNNLITAQATKDASSRVDYINQIAGCSSTNLTSGQPLTKIYACPILDTTSGNYVQYAATATSQDLSVSLGALTLSLSQNTCGKEAQNSTGNSPFVTIEGRSLASTTVINKTLVENACLRRAGSVCHTDLDCSPNHMHADVAGNYSIANYFGGTLAEQKYWSEYLVCGQAKTKPQPLDTDYFDYDMGKNLCCREIGKDITLYTSSDPKNESLSSSLSTGAISFKGPSTNYRYSRYSILPGYPNASYPTPDINTILTAGQSQWKTISETAQKTCCGGGWIRKFADGTHKWPVGSRLNFDISTFKCLNYASDISFIQPSSSVVNPINYSREYDMLCSGDEDTNHFCSQVEAPTPPGNIIEYPISYSTGVLGWTSNNIHTLPTNSHYDYWSGYLGGTSAIHLWRYLAPYKPLPVETPDDLQSYLNSTYQAGCNTSGGGSNPIKYQSGPYMKYDSSNSYRCLVASMYVPAYLYDPKNTLNGIRLDHYTGGALDNAGGPWEPTVDLAGSNSPFNSTSYVVSGKYRTRTACTSPCGTAVRTYYDDNTRILTVMLWGANNMNKDIDIVLFNDWPVGWLASPQGKIPGNDLYYLKKFAKLELSGVPQVLHEPLVCTSDSSRLVPEIYKSTSLTSFQSATGANDNGYKIINSYDILNPTQKLVSSQYLNKESVFSNNEIVCCIKLGQASTTATSCCSGSLDSAGEVCALPAKTDLNVYFNRYVSGEGVDPDGPSTLNDSDFDTYTGEPLTSTTTLNKLQTLGNKYCKDGKTRAGGAFGDYIAEPISTSGTAIKIYSIVDSYNDIDTDSTPERGVNAFVDGYRWNHHVYCDE